VAYCIVRKYSLNTAHHTSGLVFLQGSFVSLDDARQAARKVIQDTAARHDPEFNHAALNQALAEIAEGTTAILKGRIITLEFIIQER